MSAIHSGLRSASDAPNPPNIMIMYFMWSPSSGALGRRRPPVGAATPILDILHQDFWSGGVKTGDAVLLVDVRDVVVVDVGVLGVVDPPVGAVAQPQDDRCQQCGSQGAGQHGDLDMTVAFAARSEER